MRSIKTFFCALVFLLGATPLFALQYVNSNLGFAATLPDGLDEFPTNSVPNVLFSRGKMVGPKNTVIRLIVIQDLGGVMGRVDEAKRKTPPKNVTEEEAAWKSFKLPVAKVVEDFNGVPSVSFNVQVPLKPHAIQLNVAGPLSDEGKLRKEMETILGSIEGPTNWLTQEDLDQRWMGWLAFCFAVFLAIQLRGSLRISVHYGLEGTGARVAGVLILILGLGVPKLLGLVITLLASQGVHLSPRGLMISGMVISIVFTWGIIFALVQYYGNAYAKDTDAVASSGKTSATLSPQPERVIAKCGMCQAAIPDEQQKTVKVCPSCGADLSRWGR